MQTQPKPIQLTDWHRILAGGTPWEFPLEVPDRGLLPPVVLLGVLILLQRALAYWGVKRRRVELLAVGDLTLLARDGRLQLEGMRETVLAREKVYAVLRGKGV